MRDGDCAVLACGGLACGEFGLWGLGLWRLSMSRFSNLTLTDVPLHFLSVILVLGIQIDHYSTSHSCRGKSIYALVINLRQTYNILLHRTLPNET